MKKLLLFFLFISSFSFAQMPNIADVWMSHSQPYLGTIGGENQQIKLKVNISEQNRKNDQQYFLSGYSLVDKRYAKLEGKLTITK